MADVETTDATEDKANQEAKARPKCGIIMPISEIDGCPASHWAEVLSIISDAVADQGFDPQLVSTTDAGVIQGAIVKNLYENPIAVCDVSGRNPNVMFELGMRLAFDKPTVVIKDDRTEFSFDVSPLSHMSYRRDLRFSEIVAFKASLGKTVASVHHKANTPEYRSYLKHFGQYKVSTLEVHEISSDEAVRKELAAMRDTLNLLVRRSERAGITSDSTVRVGYEELLSQDAIGAAYDRVKTLVDRFRSVKRSPSIVTDPNNPELLNYVQSRLELPLPDLLVRKLVGDAAKEIDFAR